jgi:hypothetical protein
VTTALALTTCGAAHCETTKINQFVAATAELQHKIDTKTAKRGGTVTAVLTKSAPHHWRYRVAPQNAASRHIDEVRPSENEGLSKIVLTFDQARLANGQQVAIKSTIVGIYPAGSESLLPPTLSAELKVDQELPGKHGYPLNSSVADSNPVTLIAHGKDVRLEPETELLFAFAPVADTPLIWAEK